MKTIIHVAQGRFKVTTESVTGADLELDFTPIIRDFNLTGDFYLIHWQARPKGYRQFGIYSSTTDEYRSMDYLPMSYGGMSLLQLDDTVASSIPSAVIYFKGSVAQAR